MQKILGLIVAYTLSEDDVRNIADKRLRENDSSSNHVAVGEKFPMLVVRDWGGSVNGRVFLDGHDDLWITSVSEGEGPRTFSYEVAK